MAKSVSGEQKIVLAIEIRWVRRALFSRLWEIPVITVTPLSIIINLRMRLLRGRELGGDVTVGQLGFK
jgi:hypothetical protein